MQEKNLRVPEGKGCQGEINQEYETEQTTIYKIDKQ